MRKKLFASFIVVMSMALILVVQAQAQVTIDKNGDIYVEKGLKGSFPGQAIVIDGDGYLNIETGLKGKAAPVEKTGQKNCYYGDGETMVTCTCGTQIAHQAKTEIWKRVLPGQIHGSRTTLMER